MSENLENEYAGNESQSMSRREILKKAGWFVPTVAAVSLMNTATAMSNSYEDDDDWGGKGGGKDGKRGGGGKGKHGGKGKRGGRGGKGKGGRKGKRH